MITLKVYFITLPLFNVKIVIPKSIKLPRGTTWQSWNAPLTHFLHFPYVRRGVVDIIHRHASNKERVIEWYYYGYSQLISNANHIAYVCY